MPNNSAQFSVSLKKRNERERSMNVNTKYLYSGVPITPHIVRQLIKELFAGNLVQRQVIIDQVLDTHIKRRGLPPKGGGGCSGAVKKALQTMQEAGEAENPSLGYWKILPTDTEVAAETTENADLQETEVKDSPPDDSIAEVVLGTGTGSVYLFYLPTYRTRAEEHKESSWACKIGRTEHKNVLNRILAQAATALPEKPVVGLVLRTKYSLALEKALQNVLTLRSLAIEDAPGNEWFLTSPAEVIALAKVFDPHSYDSPRSK
jgi:hypothetical protein